MLSVRSPVDQPHSQTFSQILCASQWDQQIAYCPTSSARFTSIYHDCNHKQNNNQKIILWKKSIHSSKYLFSITCATWSTCSPRIVNFCTQWRTSCASAKYELLVNPATWIVNSWWDIWQFKFYEQAHWKLRKSVTTFLTRILKYWKIEEIQTWTAEKKWNYKQEPVL